MNAGELVNDKFVLKLLEDRLYASDCMINGWILTGFPKNNSQIHYLKSTKAFNPSKVINLFLDDDVTAKRSSMRKLDPVSGRFYFVSKENEGNLPKDVLNRLIVKNEDKSDIYQKRLLEYINLD
jgi:adenylate kinase